MLVFTRTTKFIALITITSFSMQVFADTPNTKQPPSNPSLPRCEVPGMIGPLDPEICAKLRLFNRENQKIEAGIMKTEKIKYSNIMTFEGPSGVGKTTLARAMAKASNSHFVDIYCPDLLDSFIGGTKDALSERIEIGIAEAKALKQRAFIFIDEIDTIVSSEKSTAHTEYDATYKVLWYYLDKNEDNGEVIFVFATNDFDRLPAPLKNRIDADLISMKNPDTEQRTALLHHFAKFYSERALEEYCSADFIQQLIKETENFSVRDIEKISMSAHKYTSYGEEPVTQEHLTRALADEKVKVIRQNTPSKEELEKQRTRR